MESKNCSKCKTNKPLTDFYTNKGYSKGLDAKCKECAKAQTREWKRKNPGYHRENLLKTQYKMTVEEYNLLRKNQNYCCAICKKHESLNQHKQLDIDHCHAEGHVRGLLCSKCNTGIGLLQDNVKVLQEAIDYILKDKKKAHKRGLRKHDGDITNLQSDGA